MYLPLFAKNNNIFTSWNFPNLKTVIKDERTMEADCKSKLKQYVHAHNL